MPLVIAFSNCLLVNAFLVNTFSYFLFPNLFLPTSCMKTKQKKSERVVFFMALMASGLWMSVSATAQSSATAQKVLTTTAQTAKTTTAVVAAPAPTATPAATDTKAEAQAKVLTDKMQQKLALTADQYPLIYDINLKYLKKNSGTVAKAEGGLAKLKAVKATQTTKEEELKAVLTEEQFAKYEGMKSQFTNAAVERFKKIKL